jgi:glycosyltransferase involved in cell wall biosynthesis
VSRIAHYLESWLDISAGFVATQITHSRHDGVIISRDGWANLEAFDLRPRHSLHVVRQRTPERLKAIVLRYQLGALLATTHADVVHVHFGYAARDVVSVTRHRPYVLSLHGHDVTGLLTQQPSHYRTVAPAVDAVIVPSTFLAERAIEAGFSAERLHVIAGGVDTEFFAAAPPAPGPPVVGFVGRLVAKKGIDTLCEAWPSIAAAVPEARLRLVGDGPMRDLVPVDPERVRHEAADPRRRREQVRDLLQAATVVVTPSHTAPDGDSESLLLVNLEAGAVGRPVVSTRHGGIPEFVSDGATGLLVPPADPTALADAVVRLLHDADLAATLGSAAIDHVKQWDVRRTTARVDALYDEVLRERRGRK